VRSGWRPGCDLNGRRLREWRVRCLIDCSSPPTRSPSATHHLESVDQANDQRLNNPSYAASSSDSNLSASPPPSSSIPEGTPKPPTTKRKFSMQALNNDEYAPVRVPRPEGVPEWGGGVGGEHAPVKGQRKTDRWV
jgi:hypothetical protein